ncbi:MAG: leucine-rich repeat domain-containing protein [Candidatus Hodarchaeales archaeon]
MSGPRHEKLGNKIALSEIDKYLIMLFEEEKRREGTIKEDYSHQLTKKEIKKRLEERNLQLSDKQLKTVKRRLENPEVFIQVLETWIYREFAEKDLQLDFFEFGNYFELDPQLRKELYERLIRSGNFSVVSSEGSEYNVPKIEFRPKDYGNKNQILEEAKSSYESKSDESTRIFTTKKEEDKEKSLEAIVQSCYGNRLPKEEIQFLFELASEECLDFDIKNDFESYFSERNITITDSRITKLILTELGPFLSGLTSLPESIGQLTQLTSLDLRDNQLSSLPVSIGQLTQLRHLDLRDNQLTSLPVSIGQLTQLRHLDLRDNQLTSLPESIGQLMQLVSLNLRENQLTNLPDSIGQLSKLIEGFYVNKLFETFFKLIVKTSGLSIEEVKSRFIQKEQELGYFENDLVIPTLLAQDMNIQFDSSSKYLYTVLQYVVEPVRIYFFPFSSSNKERIKNYLQYVTISEIINDSIYGWTIEPDEQYGVVMGREGIVILMCITQGIEEPNQKDRATYSLKENFNLGLQRSDYIIQTLTETLNGITLEEIIDSTKLLKTFSGTPAIYDEGEAYIPFDVILEHVLKHLDSYLLAKKPHVGPRFPYLSLACLKNDPDLEGITIPHTGVKQIRGLEALENNDKIQYIYSQESELEEFNLPLMGELPNLETIILQLNRLTKFDLSSLKNCKKIKAIELGANEITTIDLSPLQYCQNLEYLSLRYNSLS